jgi:hypothetical protein
MEEENLTVAKIPYLSHNSTAPQTRCHTGAQHLSPETKDN